MVARNRELELLYEHNYRVRLKMDVLTHYGGDPPKCDCCGETELLFLSLDHMNGGGNKFRKTTSACGVYTYVRRNSYPKGFRVLCMNCNFSIGHFGYCPNNGGYC